MLKDYDDQAIFSVNDSNRGHFFSGSMSVYEYDEGEVVLDLKIQNGNKENNELE